MAMLTCMHVINIERRNCPLFMHHRNTTAQGRKWRSSRLSWVSHWGERLVRCRIMMGHHYMTVYDNHHGGSVQYSQYCRGGLVVCWMAWEHEWDEVDNCDGGYNMSELEKAILREWRSSCGIRGRHLSRDICVVRRVRMVWWYLLVPWLFLLYVGPTPANILWLTRISLQGIIQHLVVGYDKLEVGELDFELCLRFICII